MVLLLIVLRETVTETRYLPGGVLFNSAKTYLSLFVSLFPPRSHSLIHPFPPNFLSNPILTPPSPSFTSFAWLCASHYQARDESVMTRHTNLHLKRRNLCLLVSGETDRKAHPDQDGDDANKPGAITVLLCVARLRKCFLPSSVFCAERCEAMVFYRLLADLNTFP